ncbi:uncharacterized protein F5Z01DRAFT_693670 [Emericellopsis atlantica]|uniref:Uncharacterized protein n=1 Tax=Emericellopsis atlantica TaxID=2614577 RepID=A0A9P8CL45_9HYPO|nr:uncharacterized protein F5Z01DRAFT_693670 [Emericellopsis atlantica]KAG9250707.1 hypothetical protein F5Z01DRAFT_693670 [Emericellopsis atlantica]
MVVRASISRKAIGSISHDHSSQTGHNSFDPESDDISLQNLARASRGRELPLYDPPERHRDRPRAGDDHDHDHEDESFVGITAATATHNHTSGYTSLAPNLEPAASSHDKRGAPSSPQLRPRHGFLFHVKAWWQELGCCLLAFGLFGGLVSLLRMYSGESPPSHLTTMVATIATICRALTVLPISEGLSQLKWNSFSRAERPLADLYAFDQASRGPMGSLQLLLTTRGRHLTCARLLGINTLAAAILLSGLATSPLTQAAIALEPPAYKVVQGAIAKRAVASGVGNSTTMDMLRQIGRQTMLMPELDRRDRIIGQLEPQCPAASCQWDPFESLAVCATTRNISSALLIQTMDLKEARRVLPGPYQKHAPPGDDYFPKLRNITLRSTSDYWWGDYFTVYDANWIGAWTPVKYLALDSATDLLTEHGGTYVARQQIMYKVDERDDLGSPGPLPSGSTGAYGAFEVNWQWCLRRYNVTVTDAVARTTMMRETIDVREYDTEELKATLVDAEGEEQFTFDFGPIALFEFRWNWTTADDVLGGQLLPDLWPQTFNESSNVQRLEEYAHRKVIDLADDMALAMSNYLRQVEESPEGKVKGRASIGLIVVVRWPWLSVLAAQIVLTAAFLGYVMVDAARTGVTIVKSSNMAELVALGKGKDVIGLDADNARGLFDGGTTQKVDKSLQASLVYTGSGWNLRVHQKDCSGERGSRVWGRVFGGGSRGP